ncbi:hypothetical protein DAKH74_056910 [Maudiozyma humilis]|uniref:Mitochondrial pyruvate carrier n=1 Tax=Maudiozyma humilis TaxID=51915 RepID=A0AAV5SCQ9_MAUHU|nr:hypothetical protein DAKH74_056910 [Kazachstania humilis]
MSNISIAFRRFWRSETGPRTVHFWAPTLKWGLVVAGLADARRPVEKVSGAQNLSLLATAAIWTRWSFVITPKNNLLAAVNAFLAATASFHLLRIVRYRVAEGDTVREACEYVVNGTVRNKEIQ